MFGSEHERIPSPILQQGSDFRPSCPSAHAESSSNAEPQHGMWGLDSRKFSILHVAPCLPHGRYEARKVTLRIEERSGGHRTPRRCSVNASPSAPARAVREKSSIPPSSTTPRRSNDGTSSTALFPMTHLKRRVWHSPPDWPRALPWRMPPANGSSERISTEVSAPRTGLSTKSARHSSRARTCKRA